MASIVETLALIDAVYRDLPDGGEASLEDRRFVEERAGAATATYGEIRPEAARDLLRWLRPDSSDVLVDVGSGAGRFALQALLCTEVERVVGIELSPFRHSVAVRARDEISRRQPELARRLRDGLELVQGDFRRHLPADTSLAWAGSICFPDALMAALGRALLAMPGLRRFVTLKELPRTIEAGMRLLGALDLDMSWAPRVRATVYAPKAPV